MMEEGEGYLLHQETGRCKEKARSVPKEVVLAAPAKEPSPTTAKEHPSASAEELRTAPAKKLATALDSETLDFGRLNFSRSPKTAKTKQPSGAPSQTPPADQPPADQQQPWMVSSGFFQFNPIYKSVPSSTQQDDEGFINMSQSWISAPQPMTVFPSKGSTQTEYLEELYVRDTGVAAHFLAGDLTMKQVSRYLEGLLGKPDYDPNQHWTSPLRSHNYHTPFDASSSPSDVSTFTITDARGTLRNELILSGCISREQLATFGVVFHIQVCSTTSDSASSFVLPNPQYKKVIPHCS